MTQKLIVIGAGMASGRVLEHLVEADRDASVSYTHLTLPTICSV